MKTKLLLLSTLLSSSVFSQTIPNSGFEILTSDNHVSQWAKSFLMNITIDSTGESHSDSIVFANPDNQLYRSTTDAHSGQYALEMTNAFNFTTHTSLAGGAFLANSDFYSALFPDLIPVAPCQPESFSFFYKFLPTAGDSAQAILTLHASDGYQIGEASITFGDEASNYTYAEIPITYFQMLPVEYISITFVNLAPATYPALGTKFIVDDVALNGNLSVTENDLTNILLYPNPASESFSISEKLNKDEVSVTDMNGSVIPFEMSAAGKINTSSWKNGCYFIHLANEQNVLTRRIVISH